MPSRHRGVIGVGVASVLMGTLLPVGGIKSVKAAPAPITFSVPSVVDPIHTVGEPDIAIDRAQNTFVSGPAGTGEQRSLWWSSVDGGSTYRVIEPVGTASALFGTANLPGGGDTDIAFDNRTPQGQYFADLAALVALRVVKSSDEGKTEVQTLLPGGKETDRQWYAVFDPPTGVITTSPVTAKPTVYIEFGPAPSTWDRSTDGQSFVSASATTHFGADGYPAIDQVTGDVFEANYNGSTISLNIGHPTDAAGDLAFRDDTGGGGLITVAPSIVNNAGEAANFVVSSMDKARNLYVTWVNRSSTSTQRQVFVAAAPANNPTGFGGCFTNCWNDFTVPIQVSDGSAATGDAVNVFPWTKAGAAGIDDSVWYGDKSTLDPSSVSAGHVWNVFMNELVFPVDPSGAVTGGAPSQNLVKVTPHPMDNVDVCLLGTGCAASVPPGNRNLADFFNITYDASGAATIVYDDISNGLLQTGPGAPSTPADHPGAPLVSVIRQASGLGLLGSVVAGPSNAPITGLQDPAGDALFPVIGGTNLPGMDLANTGGLASSLILGTTLTVTMKVADLTQLSAAGSATNGTLQEFVTRWQMGNTLYYAEASFAGSLGTAQFSGGQVQSIDLCSVSLCLPRVLTYPETPGTGTSTEAGTATCPTSPSAANPCTITINVNLADIGTPTNSSLLEEVGAYALTASHPQATTTNAQAQADNVPLEIDGVCCYNFAEPVVCLNSCTPEVPWTPALLGLGVALIGVGVWRRRRSNTRTAQATPS